MSRPRINLLRIEEELSEVHLRSAGVTIEHLEWKDFIKTYDKLRALFFLDPPYYKTPYYNHNFKLVDLQELSQTLSSLKSKFILSINDHPDMRKAFRGFSMVLAKLSYSIAQKECAKGYELLITGVETQREMAK